MLRPELLSLPSVEHKPLKASFGQEMWTGVKNGFRKLLGSKSRMGQGCRGSWVYVG